MNQKAKTNKNPSLDKQTAKERLLKSFIEHSYSTSCPPPNFSVNFSPSSVKSTNSMNYSQNISSKSRDYEEDEEISKKFEDLPFTSEEFVQKGETIAFKFHQIKRFLMSLVEYMPKEEKFRKESNFMSSNPHPKSKKLNTIHENSKSMINFTTSLQKQIENEQIAAKNLQFELKLYEELENILFSKKSFFLTNFCFNSSALESYPTSSLKIGTQLTQNLLNELLDGEDQAEEERILEIFLEKFAPAITFFKEQLLNIEKTPSPTSKVKCICQGSKFIMELMSKKFVSEINKRISLNLNSIQQQQQQNVLKEVSGDAFLPILIAVVAAFGFEYHENMGKILSFVMQYSNPALLDNTEDEYYVSTFEAALSFLNTKC